MTAWSLALSAVPWLLTVVGWFTVYRLALGRERRKIYREICAEARALVVTYEQAATKYHTSARDPALEIQIVSLVTRIEQRVAHLQAIVPKRQQRSDWPRLVVELRRAATGTNFAAADHVEQPVDSELIGAIGAAVADMVRWLDAIERQFI